MKIFLVAGPASRLDWRENTASVERLIKTELVNYNDVRNNVWGACIAWADYSKKNTNGNLSGNDGTGE
jgi:hypothetical protein